MGNFDFTAEQKKDLKRAQYFESLESSPAWKLLEVEMNRLVQEALDKMGAAAPSIPAEELKALHMRWQQRALMRDELISFVSQMKELKQQILEMATHDDDPADAGFAN